MSQVQYPEKRGKIKSFIFSKTYTPAVGGVKYCHECTMENGDTGTVYCITQDPPQYKPGVEIIYNHVQQGQRNAIKIVRIHMDEAQQAVANAAYNKTKSANRTNDFIGLAFSYAKDIVVAKINAEASKIVIPAPKTTKKAAPQETEEIDPVDLPRDPVEQLYTIAKDVFDTMCKMKEALDKKENEGEFNPDQLMS